MAQGAEFGRVVVATTRRGDGSVLLANHLAPGAVPGQTLMAWLRHWAELRPDQPFLVERDGEGRRGVTFRGALERVVALSRRLLILDVSADRPLALVAENGLDHALVMLAALRIGVPVGVLSPNYAAQGAMHGKLRDALEVLGAGAVVVDRPEAYRGALQGADVAPAIVRGLPELDAIDPAAEADADRAEALVGPETVAKLLFTSGSTGAPKAVINTQRMLVSNMQGLAAVWPFLADDPPRLVDWLPWSHTFGGNVCFDLALCFGGTFHVDAGRPTPARLGETVTAIKAVRPNLYFSVPAGYDALLPYIETDADLAACLLGETTFLFSGGAALGQVTRDRLEAAAAAIGVKLPPMSSAWGSTETAPISTVVYFPTGQSTNIGLPLPGVTLKLQPSEDRFELRVKGPNVTPGYWRNPEATAAAFDEEGFYRIGDAGRLAEPERPEAGVLYDGRLAENFKLSTGTWVNVGVVRLAAIGAADPLVADAVVAGHDRDHLGVMLFPRLAACRALLGEGCSALGDDEIADHPQVIAAVRQGFVRHNLAHAGRSLYIARFVMLAEPPQAEHGEITEKGYLNQRAILKRRAGEVRRLFEDGHEVEELD
jgi:feruloyl-CoA synthase